MQSKLKKQQQKTQQKSHLALYAFIQIFVHLGWSSFTLILHR